MNSRKQVCYWLISKYPSLCFDDAEDIFQEAAIAMWQKYHNAREQLQDSVVGLAKRFCSFGYTHWLRHEQWSIDWDDSYYPEEEQVESGFKFIPSQLVNKMWKERMYRAIDRSLQPDEREFMKMHLEKKPIKEIMQRFNLKTPQVVRNKKSKIVARLRKELGGQAQNVCPFLFLVLRFSWKKWFRRRHFTEGLQNFRVLHLIVDYR